MKRYHSTLAALAALVALVPALQAQVTIPESVALPSTAVDKTKPGFKVRVVQATQSLGELPNTLSRTEAQLAGLLRKPDGTFYENIADRSSFNPDGTFDEAGIISYGSNGFPGIPGTESTVNNIALEAITYADLAAGTYSMVVNSDDGFRVTTGDVRDRTKEIVLGFYDGGRGAGDTVFNFTVTKAGVYPFRLIYEQGGGGYSVDWFTANPTDASQRAHLNGDGGVKSYRALASSVAVPPAVTATLPAQDALNVGPSAGLTALITDGSTAVPVGSVKLARNGTDVTSAATITKAGTVITVTYLPTKLPDPLSQEVYTLTFDDATATNGKREAVIRYTVAAYANYNLPAPLWYEDFNSTAEGSLPAGWTTVSPIDPTGAEDLDDPGSDSYRVWAIISRDRVQSIGAAGRWDAARRQNTPEAYVNGTKVASLIDKNFAYHESDVRSGSQYAELISPTINLTGKTSVYLVYNSIYEQNQDNIAGTEYSIDDGKTWLPVVYMIDIPDIVKKTDGSPDAEATLTAANNDTAFYIDPNTGEEIGRTYGAFVKADKTTWKDLGAYISGRVNDDANESKRIEKYRLEKADNQAKVRLRFFQAGTGSWYYGVDNVGLYSITVIDPPALAEQPASATRFVGTTATFKVGINGAQVTYQWQKDGVNIPTATNSTLTLAGLKKTDAGKYRAVGTNPSGSVTSAEATLVVQDIPGDASSLKNGLAVYLPFNGDLKDASGNNRNGTAVGNPTFGSGKIGSGAVKVSSVRSSSTYNFVTLGSNADLPIGQTDFTVAYWMKTERVTGDPSIVANKNWGSGNNAGWTIGTQSDGRLEWNYRRVNADGLSRKDLDALGQGLAANEWRHVVVTFTINGDAISYVDGIAIDTRPIAPGTGDASDPALALNIGQDGTGAYTDGEWDGLLDDVAIWTRALSAEEVSTLYAFGVFGDSIFAPALTSGLGALLKFDGNFNDASGNNNNGTAVGNPTIATGLVGSGALSFKSVLANNDFNYVTLGNGAGVKFGETQPFSVAFWAKLGAWAGDPAFVANKNWGSGGNVGWAIATDSDGRLQWNYRRAAVDGGTQPTRRDFDSVGSLFSDNGWHHVAVVFDINGNAVTYFDGIEFAVDRSGAAARKDLIPGTGSLDAGLVLNIGQDGTGKYTDSASVEGLIDDVGIWNRTLSAREVVSIYGQGLKGFSIDGSGGGSPAPSLGYTVSNGQLRLTWTGDGFALEENTDVANPAGWTPVPGVTGNSATVSTAAGTRFFRLKK